MSEQQIDWDCLTNPKIEQLFPVEQNKFDAEEAALALPMEKIELFKQKADGFEVSTVDSCRTAMSMAMQSRKLSKAIDTERKKIAKPHRDFQTAIKSIADAFINELKSIEGKLLEDVEKFNESREEKSQELGVELSSVDSVSDGCSYDMEYWEYKVTDWNKIPDRFIKLDDRAIKEALKEGVRDIEGLDIYKVKKKRYRIK